MVDFKTKVVCVRRHSEWTSIGQFLSVSKEERHNDDLHNRTSPVDKGYGLVRREIDGRW